MRPVLTALPIFDHAAVGRKAMGCPQGDELQLFFQ